MLLKKPIKRNQLVYLCYIVVIVIVIIIIIISKS